MDIFLLCYGSLKITYSKSNINFSPWLISQQLWKYEKYKQMHFFKCMKYLCFTKQIINMKILKLPKENRIFIKK